MSVPLGSREYRPYAQLIPSGDLEPAGVLLMKDRVIRRPVLITRAPAGNHELAQIAGHAHSCRHKTKIPQARMRVTMKVVQGQKRTAKSIVQCFGQRDMTQKRELRMIRGLLGVQRRRHRLRDNEAERDSGGLAMC